MTAFIKCIHVINDVTLIFLSFIDLISRLKLCGARPETRKYINYFYGTSIVLNRKCYTSKLDDQVLKKLFKIFVCITIGYYKTFISNAVTFSVFYTTYKNSNSFCTKMIPQVFWLFVVCFKNKSIFDDRNIYSFPVQYTARYEEHIKGNILIIKIKAKVIVISLLQRFGPLLVSFSTNRKNSHELQPGID